MSNDQNHFHSQLRHFVQNQEIIDEIVPGDILGDEEIIGFNQLYQNEDEMQDILVEASDKESSDEE